MKTLHNQTLRVYAVSFTGGFQRIAQHTLFLMVLMNATQRLRISKLQQLRKLQETINLHLCIAIRLDPGTNQSLSLSLKGLIDARTVRMPDDNRDIEAYIDAELESRVESGRKLKMGNPTIILEIQQKLMKGSHGMFLWVALQVESLCSMQTDDAIRQFQKIFQKIFQRTFLSYPSEIWGTRKDLSEMYSRVRYYGVSYFNPRGTPRSSKRGSW